MSIVALTLYRQRGATAEGELVGVYTNRMRDPVYLEALYQHRSAQAHLTRDRQKTVDRMEALIAQARQRLPEGSGEAVLKAELEKSEQWLALEAENQAYIKELEAQLKAARQTVRERLLAEKHDVEAVAAKRARPLEHTEAPSHN